MPLALVGCGDPSEIRQSNAQIAAETNHGFGWRYDVQGETGMRLRYTQAIGHEHPHADITFFERRFAEFMECSGMSAPAPFIIIVPPGSLGQHPSGGFAGGRYFSKPSLIVITEDINLMDRHEEAHYLLDLTTGDWDAKHLDQLFTIPRCQV